MLLLSGIGGMDVFELIPPAKADGTSYRAAGKTQNSKSITAA